MVVSIDDQHDAGREGSGTVGIEKFAQQELHLR
jgi:hypothetical protein